MGLFIAAICLYVGIIWYDFANDANEDTLNGIILITLGLLIIISMFISFYKNTNFLFGTLTVFIHIIVLGLMITIGIPLFVAYIFCWIMALFSSKPVYLINK